MEQATSEKKKCKKCKKEINTKEGGIGDFCKKCWMIYAGSVEPDPYHGLGKKLFGV